MSGQLVEEEAQVSIQVLCLRARTELIPDLRLLRFAWFLASASRQQPQRKEFLREPIEQACLLRVKELLNYGTRLVDADSGQA